MYFNNNSYVWIVIYLEHKIFEKDIDRIAISMIKDFLIPDKISYTHSNQNLNAKEWNI